MSKKGVQVLQYTTISLFSVCIYTHTYGPLIECLEPTLEVVAPPPQGWQRGWEVYVLLSLYFDSEQLCLSVEYCLTAADSEPV